MLVGPTATCGTIGGGQLEFRATEKARSMIANGTQAEHVTLPLGPEIGQCCGGSVEIDLSRMSASDVDALQAEVCDREENLPHVYVLGAGHVGRALVRQLQHLPVRCILVDTREAELALNSADVETRLTALPEAEVKQAPEGSAFVVLTHDHALDFLLAAAALERQDAAYVGMIGSATKGAKFQSWAARETDLPNANQLVCPIGAFGRGDKRPEVIAACVSAEVMLALTSQTAVS